MAFSMPTATTMPLREEIGPSRLLWRLARSMKAEELR
jgi:hypothetical protein